MTRVLVLAGGPDAERDVSLMSGREIASALEASGREVACQTILKPTADDLRAMEGEVIFPALHGRWGEGGPLQDLLEENGRPYVGSGPIAARRAMDKTASKIEAERCGLSCSPTCVLDPADAGCPLELPVVVKPIFEGSTVGLHVCRTQDQWRRAHQAAAQSGKPTMIEPFVRGRELTQGLIAGEPDPDRLEALPFIEITPAAGLYDYQAKYLRDDTVYRVDPDIPDSLAHDLRERTLALARSMGLRDLCRADFILGDDGVAWFLEINTMPGFTSHSLVPQAARGVGLEMPELCDRLIQAAMARMPRPVRSC